MLVVNIIGGLGNQLFQYAFYFFLKSNNYEVKLDDSYFENYDLHNGYELTKAFKIQPLMATSDEVNQFKHGFKRSNNILVYIKKRMFDLYDIQNLNDKTVKWEYKEKSKNINLLNIKNAYLIGYWTRESYFQEIRKSLIDNLQFRLELPLISNNSVILDELKLGTTIAIHVRGGDYNESARLGKRYYDNAINELMKITVIKSIIVFTNDKELTKKLMGNLTYKIADNNVGDQSFIDMYLMSQASHLIIANSTFSWWAAYLNKNAKAVVYPSGFHHISSFENWIEI